MKRPRATPAAPVAGVDGYRSGWVAAVVAADRVQWAAAASFDDLLRDLDAAAAIGVDMPQGLAARGARAADLLAARALPGGASRVFAVPPRPVLEQARTLPPDRLQALSRELWGQGTSVFALALATRILELDQSLRADPVLAERTVEVHPELSFARMAGATQPSKKTAVGVAARIRLLSRSLVPDVVGSLATAPSAVPVDDCLDALAAAWSARRWMAGEADSYPDPPERDPVGLRIAIVV